MKSTFGTSSHLFPLLLFAILTPTLSAPTPVPKDILSTTPEVSLWTPKNPTNGRGSGLPRDGGWRRAVHDLGVGEMYAGASTMRDTDMEKRDVAETAGADVAELREAAVGFLPGTGLPVAEKLEFSMDPIKHPISQLREKRDPDYQVGHGGDVRDGMEDRIDMNMAGMDV